MSVNDYFIMLVKEIFFVNYDDVISNCILTNDKQNMCLYVYAYMMPQIRLSSFGLENKLEKNHFRYLLCYYIIFKTYNLVQLLNQSDYFVMGGITI